jgi:hypothetical protein
MIVIVDENEAVMALRGDALSIVIRASNPEAASLIRNDHEALTKLLKSAGYGVDDLKVEFSPAATIWGTHAPNAKSRSEFTPRSSDGPKRAGIRGRVDIFPGRIAGRTVSWE